jgi:hypothetical protein
VLSNEHLFQMELACSDARNRRIDEVFTCLCATVHLTIRINSPFVRSSCTIFPVVDKAAALHCALSAASYSCDRTIAHRASSYIAQRRHDSCVVSSPLQFSSVHDKHTMDVAPRHCATLRCRMTVVFHKDTRSFASFRFLAQLRRCRSSSRRRPSCRNP